MKIGSLAQRTGLSVHTLRYYEQVGLMPTAWRGRSHHREYDEAILPWVEFVGRLKTTGMSIREMVRYAKLREGGVTTEAERRDLLVRHREAVRDHIAELSACLCVLDAKIVGYAAPSPSTSA